MKRVCLALLMTILCFIMLSASFALSEKVLGAKQEPEHVFRLPASLLRIDEEAFLGTAAEEVLVSESVLSIQDRAFAGMKLLQHVYLPETIQSMGNEVFSGDKDLVICGLPGGEMEAYARENLIAFQPVFAEAEGSTEPTAKRSPLFFLLLCAAILNKNKLSSSFIWKIYPLRLFTRRNRVALHVLDDYFP